MKLVNSFYAEFFLNSFTVFIVQLYFIHTIWKLLEDREMWLRRPSTIAALVLATLSFAGGCGAVYRANLNHLITGVLANVTVPASIATVSAVITDIYITISLCLILNAGRTGFKRNEYLISTLIGWVIRRGFVSALVQALHFLSYIATLKESTLYWMIFHFPASKVYVNSLLAVLNVRNHIREGGTTPVYASGVTTSVQLQPMRNNVGGSSRAPSSAGITKVSPRHTGIMMTKEIIQDEEVTYSV